MKAIGMVKGFSVLVVSVLLAGLLHADSLADGQPGTPGTPGTPAQPDAAARAAP